ncbi:peptidoglycan editing factor PgeF [Neomoorella mulderi]|uniref:Purine nucleoside phosphorylase n=1 Tax=Moorella mulderi DSM 14980 TaxID=1122241 RepID=A0A151AY41_9FIRM|nr:peptidoglycan editing factor PgeF [Moorella mulderi]KYH32579.1 laccase domain protein [Moorella mulderi DSM 14980]
MAPFIRENREGMSLWRVAFLEEQAPVKAFYSTRAGGVSRPPYTGLNLGLHVGDEPAAVLANRRLLATALDLPLEDWVIGEQVHGNRVALVGRQDTGRGAAELATALPGVDALVTAAPGVTLVAFFADCVPLYLVDPVRGVIGLAHAGWKGTVLQVGTQVVARMAAEFNSNPNDLLAAIGPAIGPCCYQVDNRVAGAVKEHLPWAGEVLTPDGPGHYRLDLPRANYLELLAAGLKPEHITSAGLCTCCRAGTFFSYRAAGGPTGRQAALLSLLR